MNACEGYLREDTMLMKACMHTHMLSRQQYCIARVRLEKSSTSATIPQLFSKKVETSTELPTTEQHKTPEIEEGEEYEFHWQEKIFSQVQVFAFKNTLETFFESAIKCSVTLHCNALHCVH